MLEKILSFLFTLGLIGWNVFDITNGRGTTFTWIMLSFFSLVGLFELGAIFEARKKRNAGKHCPVLCFVTYSRMILSKQYLEWL